MGAVGSEARGRQSRRGRIIGELSDIESGHEKCNQSFWREKSIFLGD